MQVQNTYANVMSLQAKLGLRLYTRPCGGGRDVLVQDGDITSVARIFDGSPEAMDFDARPAAAIANGVVFGQKGRSKTKNFADPSTWTGDSLPDGHADKPGSTFVTRDAGGVATVWHYHTDQVATCPTGYFSRLDGTTFDANNAATFWVPKSTQRINVSAGMRSVITGAKIECNPGVMIDPGGTVDFQFWTYVNPNTGKLAKPTDTFRYNVTQARPWFPNDDPGDMVVDAPCPLYAPPAGLWRYASITELRDLCDRWTHSSFDLAGETGLGGRLALYFEYVDRLADDIAEEVAIEGTYGQFIEMKITNHVPLASAVHAVASFRIVTRASL